MHATVIGCDVMRLNQEIIRARQITELRLNNKKAHQLTHTLRNLLTIHRLMLEQIHRIHPTFQGQLSVAPTSNNFVSTMNVTEEKEPLKPPPDEDEPKPPIKEPPIEEPPVREPPPKNRQSGLLIQ
jgi:hypothetical protein